MVEHALRSCSRTLLLAAALALMLMMAILTYQVVARYVLNSSPAWAEQSALILMIWLTFLGTAVGIAEGFHISILEGVAHLPDHLRKRAIFIANFLILIAGLLILWLGLALCAETWTNAVPTLPVTRGMVYLVMPLSGGLTAIFATDHLLRGKAVEGSLTSG